MRKLLKFLHTLGAIGFAGAIAAQLVLVSISPEPADLAGYALLREGIAAISTWVLVPSMAAVVVLYFPCRWWAGQKKVRTEWWVRYL